MDMIRIYVLKIILAEISLNNSRDEIVEEFQAKSYDIIRYH